ncbi:MAG: FAD:protein FMN transferase [Gemmatimonadota bacterium]|nr:FAD:protein FMN transferase [Gemmatimonadota bacterium]
MPGCLALLLWIPTAACGGGQQVRGERLPVTRAVQAMYEELPGTVITRSHRVLDGELRITVAGSDSAAAVSAIEAAFAAADSVDHLVGLHRETSEVLAINAAAGREPVRVSPWTETIVAASLDWARRTQGAFDPTVAPLLDVWGFGRGAGATPDSAHVAEAMRRVGWRKVRHDPAESTVFLTEPGMELDLRAAARGFALDRSVDAMQQAGAIGGVADIDGDQRFFGPGIGTRGDLWPVSVPDPYSPGRAYARLEVPSGGVSTSSPYARVVEVDEVQYGHVLDPRTGYPTRGLASVTVYAPDALTSDILSTAMLVLGQGVECRLAEKWPQLKLLYVVEAETGEPSRVCTTRGMRQYVKEIEPPVRPDLEYDE